MRVAGDNEDYTQQQQPMGMSNQPQKESIGALLALFIASKGGKILSTIAIIAMLILFKFAPIIASILTMGYLIIISIINFSTGKIRLGQLIGCIIGCIIAFIFIGFVVIVSC